MNAGCPMCGCQEAKVLGPMGVLFWVRCRACDTCYTAEQPECCSEEEA